MSKNTWPRMANCATLLIQPPQRHITWDGLSALHSQRANLFVVHRRRLLKFVMPGRKPGVCDYSAEIQCEAVQCYLQCCSGEDKRLLLDTHLVQTSHGGRRDGAKTVFQLAHEKLKYRVWADPADAERVSNMTDRHFRTLVIRHAAGVIERGNLYRRTRAAPEQPLSTTPRKA